MAYVLTINGDESLIEDRDQLLGRLIALAKHIVDEVADPEFSGEYEAVIGIR